MKTFEVKMTDAQAARIEKTADALRMDPSDLIKTFVLSDLDGWFSAGEFLEVWPDMREAYATRATVGTASERIENKLAEMFSDRRKKRAA